VKELPDLDLQMDIMRRRSRFRLLETEERFVRRYSFGTACGIYMMNRTLWPFLLLIAICAMSPLLTRAPLWFVVMMLVILVLYPPGFIFMCVVAGIVSNSAPFLVIGRLHKLVGGGGVIFYLAAGIFAFIIAIAGVYARQRRWQTLEWANFEEFHHLETRWQAVGIVLWIMLLALLASAYFMNNFEDIFPIIWGTDFA